MGESEGVREGCCCSLCLHRISPLGFFPLHNHLPTPQLCPTRSIWTIDLAHLLRGCGAEVAFLTVTLGANAAYARERFYAETMGRDAARVERLFQVRGVR